MTTKAYARGEPTAQMKLIGREFERGADYPDDPVPAPPYQAISFVSHSPGEDGRGLCGTLIRVGNPVAVHLPPTCNQCQRAIAKPVYDRNRKKPRPKARRIPFKRGRQYETREQIDARA